MDWAHDPDTDRAIAGARLMTLLMLIHLSRVFRQESKFTLFAFLNEVRMHGCPPSDFIIRQQKAEVTGRIRRSGSRG